MSEVHPRPDWAHAVRSKVTRDVAVALVELPQVQTAVQLGASAGLVVDRDMQAIEAGLAEQGTPVACRKGCTFCCHYRISVVPIEAITVAQFVRELFTEEARASLRERVKGYNETLASLPPEQRLTRPLPCPFLHESGDCMVYPVRPLSCRMHHSLDASACEKTLEDPDAPVPVPEDFRAAAAPVLSGLNRGAKMALKKAGDLEYIAAIEILLEEEDAAERWLAGEDSLGRAHDAEVRAVVEAKSEGRAGI